VLPSPLRGYLGCFLAPNLGLAPPGYMPSALRAWDAYGTACYAFRSAWDAFSFACYAFRSALYAFSSAL